MDDLKSVFGWRGFASMEKAKAMPLHIRRQWADGHWHEKVAPGKWKYIGWSKPGTPLPGAEPGQLEFPFREPAGAPAPSKPAEPPRPVREFMGRNAVEVEEAIKEKAPHAKVKLPDTDSTSAVFFLEDDDTHSVFKPDSLSAHTVRSIRPMLDISVPGSKREVAAYKVDEWLGFEIVPPTVEFERHVGRREVQLLKQRFEGEGSPKGDRPIDTSRPGTHHGSLQAFVPDAQEPCKMGLFLAEDVKDFAENNPEAAVTLEKMAVLDVIIGNVDRHRGNFLIGDDARLYAIDNGLSFPAEDAAEISQEHVGFMKSVPVRALEGKPLSPEVMHRLKELNPKDLRKILEPFGFQRGEADAAIARFKWLRTYECFPEEDEYESDVFAKPED